MQQTKVSKSMFYVGSFLAAAVMALTTGCASGGYKLTREYAGFVNQQHIIIRILLYLITGVIFAVTMLVDLVYNNTMDFWEGRVSQGIFEFNKDGKTFVANHEILPGNLKRSTIDVKNKENQLLQKVVIQQLASGEIEVVVDGTTRARVRDILSLPIASMFNSEGRLIEEKVLLFDVPMKTIAAK